MNYIYHAAPEQMVGSLLMPLNQMQSSHPELYKLHSAKYKGRAEIMERRVPLLDCLWNDVVQFLPLDPQNVFDFQKQLGLIKNVSPIKFFKIDPGILDPTKTVVFFKTAPGEQNVEVKWLRDVDLAKIQEVPEATINYYKSLIGTGERPFNYQFIPHLLYKGTVDVSKSSTISLRQHSG